jgi:hypothetical protein
LGDAALAALTTYVADVRGGEFPTTAQTYKPNSGETPRAPSERRILRRDLGLEVDDLDTPLPLDHWH